MPADIVYDSLKFPRIDQIISKPYTERYLPRFECTKGERLFVAVLCSSITPSDLCTFCKDCHGQGAIFYFFD